jgi:fibronectin type 3 domain-containing protein
VKKLLILACCLAFLTGCSNNGFGLSKDSKSKQPQITTIDSSLPKPANIKTISARNQIGFEWTLVDNPRITAVAIYKSDVNGSFTKIATIDDRFATHYADVGLNPDTTYYYRFATNAAGGVESDLGAPITTKTLPVLEAVTFIAPIDNLPKRAKIVWKPHTNDSVIEYQVQKTDTTGRDWTVIATVGPRLLAEYLDVNVQSGQTYVYRVIAKTFDGQLSLPSKTVQVRPKNLPLAIVDINATKTIPKKIVVQWKGPNQSFEAYQLYRATKPDANFEPILKTKETIYNDNIAEDGAVRYYKVAVVDKDGLESTAQQVATGTTKPLPPTPNFTQATVSENKVQLAWERPQYKEPLKYRITKKWGTISPKEVVIEDIPGTIFVDTDVVQGTKYTYYVQSVDKDGLFSTPSDGAELNVPKLQD